MKTLVKPFPCILELFHLSSGELGIFGNIFALARCPKWLMLMVFYHQCTVMTAKYSWLSAFKHMNRLTATQSCVSHLKVDLKNTAHMPLCPSSTVSMCCCSVQTGLLSSQGGSCTIKRCPLMRQRCLMTWCVWASEWHLMRDDETFSSSIKTGEWGMKAGWWLL